MKIKRLLKLTTLFHVRLCDLNHLNLYRIENLDKHLIPMKKLLLSLATLASVTAFAQEVYPDAISPEGWLNPMPMDKITAGDYMSKTANTGVDDIMFSADDNTLKIEKKDTTGEFASVSFEVFDATGIDAIQVNVDATSEPVVYLKMKGAIGDKVTLNLKDKSFTAYLVGDDWSDAAYTEEISCEDYRWYKFDYAAKSAEIDEVRSIEIVINNGKSGAATVWVDSLILGEVNYTPSIPQDIVDVRWDVDLSVPWFTTADPAGTPIADNILELDTNNFYQATIASTSPAHKGVQFTINDASGYLKLDISENPFVRTVIKGTPGDTVRINLFYTDDFFFVNSYKIHVFASSDYEEVIFDYSDSESPLSEVNLVEMILNPNSQVDGVFFVQELTVGDYEATGCNSDAVSGVFNNIAKVNTLSFYPNPVTDGAIYFEKELTNITVFDMLGEAKLTSAKANSLHVSQLSTGVYMAHTDEGMFKFIIQ